MESAKQFSSTEFDTIVAERYMLPFQLPYEGSCTDRVVEQEFGMGADFQVHAGSISASCSLHSDLHNPPNFNNGPHATSQLRTLDDFRTDGVEETLHTEPPTPLTIPTKSTQGKSYSEDIWDLHKPQIWHLYLEEGKKLQEVMCQMRQDEGFEPS